MKIIVDDREHDLLNSFATLFTGDISRPFDIVKQTLHIGDVVLTPGSLDGDEYCIIERKSLSDLLSSIKDGRYDEQSHRLSYASTCPNHRIIYIIEGNMNSLKNASEYKTVCSAITSLSMYKGFSVMRTSSVQETARLIFHMAEKIIKNNNKNQQFYGGISCLTGNTANDQSGEPPVNYCNLVKKVKKDNITPDNIGEIILSQIPGVSSITAIAIMNNFKSFYNLIESLQKDKTCLDNLTITKNEKTRKISKKVLEDIKLYLLHNPINGIA
jgi:crossover junction endonuclease MUS81